MAPVCLENFDAPFIKPVNVGGDNAVQLLAKIEANTPKQIICPSDLAQCGLPPLRGSQKMALTSEMPYPSDPVVIPPKLRGYGSRIFLARYLRRF